MADEGKNRDLVLSQGSYAYMQDTTKGGIKTYTGPIVVTPTTQERPVSYNAKTGAFNPCRSLEEAVCKSVVAPEGFYVTLLNPAKKGEHPAENSNQAAADLDVGRKVNINGPAMFSLWPGQSAELIRGHQLRSNQYLLARVYNEEMARKNWELAVIKPADVTQQPGHPGGDKTQEEKGLIQAPSKVSAKPPPNLTVGSLFIIRGTEVSFYIPPTGIVVVAESIDGSGKAVFARDALTLERLEYSILVDENGNKRYNNGPDVVFPNPTERFLEQLNEKTKERDRKFRAIELNEIQGIHVKVIADYEEKEGKEGQTTLTRKAGDELFITGKDTKIYYPREEHSAIKYDGKTKHFATAIPAGEGRYVMNRMDGQIKTVKGFKMLLPDPRTEIIVRRVLSEKQVGLWYPGNEEARLYNATLRNVLEKAPTTRHGAVSEGDVDRNFLRSARVTASAGAAASETKTKGGVIGGHQLIGSAYLSNNSLMEQSQVSKEQGFVGSEFERSSTHTQPRTITIDSKYQGVPTIELWTGYAVQVVSKEGDRRVVRGPATVQLEYDESLEVLELSTGKPKTTDNLLRTVYLRVDNNKISDTLLVETKDHVKIRILVSYLVNFEGEGVVQQKWFAVENYVKFLCDHVRSVVKGHIQKIRVEDFYSNSTDVIRDLILGGGGDGNRTGMLFKENNMKVMDVEVLGVLIDDERIRSLLDVAQHEVVKTNIELSTINRNLETFKEKQRVEKEELETKTATMMFKNKLDMEIASSMFSKELDKIHGELLAMVERKKLEEEVQELKNLSFEAELNRSSVSNTQRQEIAEKDQAIFIQGMQAEAESVIKRFTAAQSGFSEALLSLSNNETLQKVAEAWSIQRVIGGDSISDALSKVFANTPLAPLMNRLSAQAGSGGSNGKDKMLSAPPA